MVKAHPPPGKAQSHFRIRHDRIDKTGRVTLRYDSRLRHIGRMGAEQSSLWWPTETCASSTPTPVSSLIRSLTIDPAKDYQPLDST